MIELSKDFDHDEKSGLRQRIFNGWLRENIVNRGLVRIKVSDSGREEARQMLYEPRTWLRGEHLPEDRIQPWEKLLWGLGAFLRNAANGFSDRRGFLWISTFGINPNHISIQTIANNIWDGINDPLVGQFMDRRPFKDNTYRWIMRINHVIGQFLTLFFMLDLGLSPVQRVAMFGIAQAARNILGTMAGVSEVKYRAGITPLSEERARLQVWQHAFHKLGYPIYNLPFYMMGFIADRYHWTDYRIITRGLIMVMPFALAGGIVHTFARNRVSFDHAKNATQTNKKTSQEPEQKLTLRETFSVLRHNKFFLYWLIANFIRVFVPTFNNDFLWRFLVPTIRLPLFGETHGPAIPALMGQFSGLPITFLVPFMRQIVDVFGGPKRAMIFREAGIFSVRLGQYFIGLNTRGRILGHFGLDTIRETIEPIGDLGEHILDFEMLDYVEYKTGVRSEGITRSIRGFTEKIVKENVATFAGNFFLAWSGVQTIDGSQPNPVVPERFARWAFPVWMLGEALRALIMLVARIAIPYKVGQNQHIELELRERRALAEQAKQELEQEPETVSK